MRTLLQITVMMTVVWTTSSCKTQLRPFDGTIVYKISVEQPENSSIPTEQFKMMFQDVDTLAQLYLKDSFYKLVTLDATTNKPKSVTLYRPDSNKIYSYMAGQNELCFASNILIDSLPEVKTTENLEDTTLILGKVCHSMTISQESGVKNLVYFSKDYKIDKKSYEKHQVGFLQYLYETESLPLKVVMSGNGAVHEMVFTATEVNKDPINDRTFELPEFMQILNSGQN